MCLYVILWLWVLARALLPVRGRSFGLAIVDPWVTFTGMDSMLMHMRKLCA